VVKIPNPDFFDVTDRFIIAVDFDGVIHEYGKGWHDGTIYGEPVKGCREAFNILMGKGVEIVIHSVRACTREIDGEIEPGQADAIRSWMDKHKIPYTTIWEGFGKPIAHMYIDDRGHKFTGSWERSVGAIFQELGIE
jgi:hypothetical protein